jgi:hypothetical protein
VCNLSKGDESNQKLWDADELVHFALDLLGGGGLRVLRPANQVTVTKGQAASRKVREEGEGASA